MDRRSLHSIGAMALAIALVVSTAIAPACACATPVQPKTKTKSTCCGDSEGACSAQSDAKGCCESDAASGSACKSKCESGCTCSSAHPQTALIQRDLDVRSAESKTKPVGAQFVAGLPDGYLAQIAPSAPIAGAMSTRPSPPTLSQTCAFRC